MSPMVEVMNMKKTKTMDIVMTKEHLGESIQQHLRAFGYFQEDDDHFNLTHVEVRADGQVLVKGRME